MPEIDLADRYVYVCRKDCKCGKNYGPLFRNSNNLTSEDTNSKE